MNRLPPLIGVALSFVALGILPSAARAQAGVAGSGGASFVQGETRLSFTLGQAVVGVVGSDLDASQGFWHPLAVAKTAPGFDLIASPTLAALPNPFSRTTMLRFSLPNAGHVSLALYDALGHRVRALIDDDYEEGPALMTVDLDELPSGSYTAVLHVGDRSVTATLVVID